MLLVSIDVGIFNLGMVCCNINDDYTLNEVLWCQLINVKNLVEHCTIKNCDLYHNLCMADYMTHLFHTYEHYFKNAEIILVEQQPPCGFISIQEIIRFQYRDKVKIISPNSVHAHFKINNLDYAKRKEFTVKFSTPYLKQFDYFNRLVRAHDVCDGFVMMMYYLSKKSDKYNMDLTKQRVREDNKKFISDINLFRYCPDS